MLSMRQLIFLAFLLCGLFRVSAQQTNGAYTPPLVAKVSILNEKFCRADADVFTVSIKLKIEVTNSSKSTVHLLWPMVPWVGKVASNLEEAEAGHFLSEQTASHYPQDSIHFESLKIEPGKKVILQSGYDLIARHDPAFSLPKSLATGSYGLILVLRQSITSNKIPQSSIGDRTGENRGQTGRFLIILFLMACLGTIPN